MQDPVDVFTEHVAKAWDLMVMRSALEALPSAPEGAALVAACRTGAAVTAIEEKAPGIHRVMAVDERAEFVEASRAALADVRPRVHFAVQGLNALRYGNGVFHLATCLHGVVSAADLRNALATLTPFVQAQGYVVAAYPTRGSLGVLTEMWRESAAFLDADGLAEDATAALAGPQEHRAIADGLGLRIVADGEWSLPIAADHAIAFLAHPLVSPIAQGIWRPLAGGEAAQDVEERLRTYYADDAIDDAIHAAWFVAEVEDATLDVDDIDVLDATSE